MTAPAGAAYVVAAVLLGLGLLGDSAACLVLAGVVFVAQLAAEVVIIASALHNAGPYAAAVARALVETRMVSPPARAALRRWVLGG